MKCIHCNSEWKVEPQVATTMKNCPFCGKPLSSEKKEMAETLDGVLFLIAEQFGMENLRDGNRMMAFFADLAPKLKREQRLLGYFVEAEGHKVLFEARNFEGADQQLAFGKVLRRMTDEMLMDKTASQQVCEAYWAAVTGKPIQVRTSPQQPENNSAPVKQENLQSKGSQSSQWTHGQYVSPKDRVSTPSKLEHKTQTASWDYSKYAKLKEHSSLRASGKKDRKPASQMYRAKELNEVLKELGCNAVDARIIDAVYIDKAVVYKVDFDPDSLYAQQSYYTQKIIKSEAAIAKAMGVSKVKVDYCMKDGCLITSIEVPDRTNKNESCVGSNPVKQQDTSHQHTVTASNVYSPKDAVEQRMIADAYYKAQSFKDAVYWYRKAAEQGDALSRAELGNCYLNGKGVNKDFTQAVYWYRKADEKGVLLARFHLRKCYESIVTKERVQTIVDKYGFSKYYLYAGMKHFDKQVLKAKESYASYADDETPLLMHDFSLLAAFNMRGWGSAKEGFVLTNRNIYYNISGRKMKIPLEEIRSVTIAQGNGSSDFGDVILLTKTGSTDCRHSVLIRRLQDLQSMWKELFCL